VWWAGLVAVGLLGAVGGGLVWLRSPPAERFRAASERELQTEVASTLTVRRFASNRAILVLDFPTLAEQGQMLNRLAAWAEKRGVPHDRLLNDAELDAVITASGATPATFYYGHDYRAADIDRFFALADAERLTLNPEEARLRRLIAQARAEQPGVGAMISVPRADAANGVDAAARAAILHHELSHGEYFTNPAYAAFVGSIWRDVLSESERAAFRRFLADEGYDPALEDLMINEMGAYLMFTPDRRFFDPAALGIPAARLDAIEERFAAQMPAGWLREDIVANPA